MQFQKYIFISKKSFFKKICPYINYIQLDTSGHSLGKQVILCVSKCMYSLIRKKKLVSLSQIKMIYMCFIYLLALLALMKKNLQFNKTY